MDIERGSLDEITRPASSDRPRTGSRPSSRISLSSASLSRPPARITTPTLLESLPPEDISQQEYDLEVVEYHSSDSDDEGNGNHNATDALKQLLLINPGNTGESQSLSLDVGDTGEPPTPSDSREQQSESSPTRDEENEDDAIQDPKLRAAIKKMKKLDKILAQKIKREKEVKRQRIQLEKDMQAELERAKPEGREELKEVRENTLKFLALAPPPSHNEGVDIDDDPSVPVTPVFATQPNLENADGASTDRSRTTNASENTTTSAGASSKVSKDSRPDSNTTKTSAGKRRRSSKQRANKTETGLHKKDGSDFIQRNIELASDASNVIAMTDDEKKRLEELLGDVEMLKEEDEENTNFNPFQLQVAPGLGFRPDDLEQKAMDEIDLRLQALLPRDDFESICSSSRTSYLDKSELQFTRKEYQESMDLMLLGEKALRDTKEMRDQQSRLKEIEDELTHLQLRVESEIEYPSLSNIQLEDLLDQCSRVSSRATEETNAIANSPRSPSQNSSIQSIPENHPPKLPDDVLRRLLEDARQELQISSSRLSTVREEEMTPMRSDTFSESLISESVDSDVKVDANERDMVLQSVSEDAIKELLENPRATSRAMSRSSQGSVTPTPNSSENTPRNHILTDNGTFTEGFDSIGGSDSQIFTPRRKLPYGRPGVQVQSSEGQDEHSEFNEKDETPTPRGSLSKEQPQRKDYGDPNARIEDLEESVDMRVLSLLADQREKTLTSLQELGVGSQDEEIESDLTDDDFGLNDDESLESELRALNVGTPSTNSRSSSQLSNLRTESGMSIEELRISNSAFDSRPSSKAVSQGIPITPEPLPKPPSKASSVKNSARNVKSSSKAQIMISRSDVNATASRAASETSTLRSDSANTMVESSDFDYENDAEIREQLLFEEEQAILGRKQQYRRKGLESVASSASSFQSPSPKPHPPRGGRKSINGKGRKGAPTSASDSEKRFSPPLI
ncbi:uncharacterized protein LOC144452885 [Glandiceps talaboti]